MLRPVRILVFQMPERLVVGHIIPVQQFVIDHVFDGFSWDI